MKNHNCTTANFLIVGAMKAGTSSLANVLDQHPKIFIPKNELHFFNRDENYKKGYDFYNENFNKNFLNGEKTPSYSYQENCAERIYKYNKNLKLIWILRNPINRAISNYYHAFNKNKESLSMLNAYLKQNERMKENIFKGYFYRSLYSIQIDRFLKFFPENQFFFCLFEEFKENQNLIANKLCNFLGVGSYEFKKIHSNKTKILTNLKIKNYFLNNYFLKKKLKKQLNEYYKNEIYKLSKLLKKDLYKLWH